MSTLSTMQRDSAEALLLSLYIPTDTMRQLPTLGLSVELLRMIASYQETKRLGAYMMLEAVFGEDASSSVRHTVEVARIMQLAPEDR